MITCGGSSLGPPDSGRNVEGPSTKRRGRKWCIGIRRGPSPLAVSEPGAGLNPVLQAENIDDIDAAYVADPFIMLANQVMIMFFEIKNRSTRRGEVGLAVGDGENWNYQGSVLREPYHLSYPYVFECDGEYFMVPESLEPGAIRLYRGDPFPSHWVYEADLVHGQFADPSIFQFHGRWWMFACSAPFQHNVLRLFHSDRLVGPWREHALSPVIKDDARRARPAGRIVVWNDRLIRFAQDCVPAYGMSVRGFEITEISPGYYREIECPSNPILSGSGVGWNRDGMHHIDPYQISEGDWIASVDGWRYWPPLPDE